jgi:hypothetical protein
MSTEVLFSEIIDEVLTQLGITTDSAETALINSIKLRINQINSEIYYHDTWEWRKERFYLSTRAPITDGTIDVTKNSRSVTGSGTSFTDIIKFGSLVIGSKIFKIDPHVTVTSTSFNLVAPYPDATQAGISYKVVFPDYIIDNDIASLVSIFNDAGKQIDLKGSQRLVLNAAEGGSPTESALVESTEFVYYETGSVTVTNGSKAVVGVGTTFTSDMIGMPFRVGEHPETYTIQEVGSSTTLTLRQEYKGNTGSGKSYQIAPKGTLMLRMSPVPDDVYFFTIEALVRSRKLFANNDRSRIPDHSALIFGSVWLAYKDLSKKSGVELEQAKKTYMDSLKNLKNMYKTITNIQWQSGAEAAFRSGHKADRFNPLDQ